MGKNTKLSSALPINALYGMRPRVDRVLGISNPHKTISPMTASLGKGTSTIVGPVPKGMGKIGRINLEAINRKRNLFGGGPPVGPAMQVSQKPRAPMIRLANAFPTEEEAIAALRGDDLDPFGRFVSKEARAARIVEAIDMLDVVRNDPDPIEKTAALVRLAELRKDAVFGAALRGHGSLSA